MQFVKWFSQAGHRFVNHRILYPFNAPLKIESVSTTNTRSYGSYDNTYGKDSQSTAREIKNFLRTKNINAQQGPTCFKCMNVLPKLKLSKLGRPRREETSQMTLFINKTTGHFVCTETGRTGNWENLRAFINQPHTTKIDLQVDSSTDSDADKIKKIWEEAIHLSDLTDLEREELLGKFNLCAIPLSNIEQYGIRTTKNASSLLIPWFSGTNRIGSSKHGVKEMPVGLKSYLSTEDSNETNLEFNSTHIPRKKYWSLFGLSHIPQSSKTVVLTMSEIDAIAINSSGCGHKAISLPYGVTHLPLEVLPYLEQFDCLIFWFGNSLVSWEAARQFSKKLDEKRCRLVRPTPGIRSPLHAFSQNLDIDKILASAVAAEIKNIVSFTDLRGFVKDELMNFDTVCGVKWNRFPHITDKLKGHRRGELTVLTGPTGCGKTTFMSEYSLDLALQGVSTLWGSFEIQNVRLLKTMMKQFARSKLENHMNDFENIADKFQTLPIHFMTYSGPQSIKEVIQTMRQAAYVYDIQHIVIDNLQFMMGTMAKSNDRFMVQDALIGEFRNFASTEHIHVTIVIHPRKEDTGLPLQISSIFGTAKATQESDNVIILQHVTSFDEKSPFKRNYLEIVKNRYDGELGKVPLYFDRQSLCMSKIPDTEIESKANIASGFVEKGSRHSNCKGEGHNVSSDNGQKSDFTPSLFIEYQEKKH